MSSSSARPAGKSTFKNIICGLVAPDVGSIEIQGKSYSHLTPQDARSLGIGAIHQELSLFPNLSIAENVHMGIGTLPTRAGLVDRAAMAQETSRLLGEFFRSPVDPRTLVERLSVGERQLIEIAKALRRASTMLILDEPTASLSLPERRRLFDVARGLRERGYALIYITHFMEEVYELADRIVVLRDGRVVGAGARREIDRRRLTSLMVGRELAKIDADLASAQTAASSGNSAAVTLSLRDVSDSQLLRGVTFDLHVGEVLGLAGLMGAGRSEVAEAIFGIHPADGEIAIAGRPFEDRTPKLRRLGVWLWSRRTAVPIKFFRGAASARILPPRCLDRSRSASDSCRRRDSANAPRS